MAFGSDEVPTFSAALKSTLAKFVPSETTVTSGISCLNSLVLSWVSCSRLSGSDIIACLSIGVRPIRLGPLCMKLPRSHTEAHTMLWSYDVNFGAPTLLRPTVGCVCAHYPVETFDALPPNSIAMECQYIFSRNCFIYYSCYRWRVYVLVFDQIRSLLCVTP